MTLALVPFAVDLPTSLGLASDALRVRLAPGEQHADLWPAIDSSIRSARATGGLLRSEGVAHGVVVWEPAGPLGVAVRLLYLAPAAASTESYHEALDLTERAAGPIAFAPGPLAGLSAEEESRLMTGRGYAPYARLEMGFPATSPLPATPSLPKGEVRPVHPDDEPLLARLHENAYRYHLDRYLSIEDADPARDSDHQLRDYFGGRWGPPLSPGSTVVVLDGRIVAAALAVQRTSKVLIIDVMAEPTLQGKGLGRAALAGALAALRDRGATAIVLNVTEANERAVRLYTGLGFVRTLGPSQEWYNARRMRVEIPPAAAGHSVGAGTDSAGR